LHPLSKQAAARRLNSPRARHFQAAITHGAPRIPSSERMPSTGWCTTVTFLCASARRVKSASGEKQHAAMRAKMRPRMRRCWTGSASSSGDESVRGIDANALVVPMSDVVWPSAWGGWWLVVALGSALGRRSRMYKSSFTAKFSRADTRNGQTHRAQLRAPTALQRLKMAAAPEA